MRQSSSRHRPLEPAASPKSAMPLEREPRPYSGGARTDSRSAALALTAPSRANPDSPEIQRVKAKKPSTSTAMTTSPIVPARNTSPPQQSRSGHANNADRGESSKAPSSRKATSSVKAGRSRDAGSETAKGASCRSRDLPKPFPLDTSSPYDVLGINETATAEEVRKAYKRAALSWHPDLCTGNAEEKALATKRFQLVAEAYAVLGDPAWRAEYDQERRTSGEATGSDQLTRQAPSSYRSTFRPGHQTAPSRPKAQSQADAEGAHRVPYRHSQVDRAAETDLRNIDPFRLFLRLVSDPETISGMMEHLPGNVSDPSNGQAFRLHDSRTSAHISEQGRVSFNKTDKTIERHAAGGFSYTSHSVTASFGTSNLGMTQDMLGSMHLGNGASVGTGVEDQIGDQFGGLVQSVLGGLGGGMLGITHPRGYQTGQAPALANETRRQALRGSQQRRNHPQRTLAAAQHADTGLLLLPGRPSNALQAAFGPDGTFEHAFGRRRGR